MEVEYSNGGKIYPWEYSCFLYGSSIFPDFACHKIQALRAPTPSLIQHTHLSREEGEMKRLTVHLRHLIFLFTQEVPDVVVSP